MTRAPQVGDRIQVTGTVLTEPRGGFRRVVFDGDTNNNWNEMTQAAIAAGTLLPRPLKVGDRVRLRSHLYRNDTAVILIIDDDMAGIKYADGNRVWHPLSDLTLADSEGQK